MSTYTGLPLARHQIPPHSDRESLPSQTSLCAKSNFCDAYFLIIIRLVEPFPQLQLSNMVQKAEIRLPGHYWCYVHLSLLRLTELCMVVHFIWHLLCTMLWQCSPGTLHSTLCTVQFTPNTVHTVHITERNSL